MSRQAIVEVIILALMATVIAGAFVLASASQTPPAGCAPILVEVFTLQDVAGALDLDSDSATARPPVTFHFSVDTTEVRLARVADFLDSVDAECYTVGVR